MKNTTEMNNIPQIRLINQQLINPQFSHVEEVVEWMGMLQAQEYRMMRWAVAMRTSVPSFSSFKSAYDSGHIIRTHLFRCTWQLVSSNDLMWMLSLCRDRNRQQLKGYLSLTTKSISESEYEHFNGLLIDLLQDEKSVGKSELYQLLRSRGIEDDPYIISVYLLRAEIDGIVCSGYLDDKQHTYALIQNRIPNSTLLERDEALALLAKKYFRSHAPASLKDFVWWTNLPVNDCRQAISAIHNELNEIEIDGEIYYIHQDCRTEGDILKMILLPSYDEYLIGYKSRHFVLDSEYQHCAYSSNGIFHPVIVRHGNVVGDWRPQKSTPSFFNKEWNQEFDKALKNYRRFWTT